MKSCFIHLFFRPYSALLLSIIHFPRCHVCWLYVLPDVVD